MTEAIIVGLLAFFGTALGAVGGIIAAARLTNHRLQQLEKQVEKHNNLVERMVAVEQSTKSAHHRVDGTNERVKALETTRRTFTIHQEAGS